MGNEQSKILSAGNTTHDGPAIAIDRSVLENILKCTSNGNDSEASPRYPEEALISTAPHRDISIQSIRQCLDAFGVPNNHPFFHPIDNLGAIGKSVGHGSVSRSRLCDTPHSTESLSIADEEKLEHFSDGAAQRHLLCSTPCSDLESMLLQREVKGSLNNRSINDAASVFSWQEPFEDEHLDASTAFPHQVTPPCTSEHWSADHTNSLGKRHEEASKNSSNNANTPHIDDSPLPYTEQNQKLNDSREADIFSPIVETSERSYTSLFPANNSAKRVRTQKATYENVKTTKSHKTSLQQWQGIQEEGSPCKTFGERTNTAGGLKTDAKATKSLITLIKSMHLPKKKRKSIQFQKKDETAIPSGSDIWERIEFYATTPVELWATDMSVTGRRLCSRRGPKTGQKEGMYCL